MSDLEDKIGDLTEFLQNKLDKGWDSDVETYREEIRKRIPRKLLFIAFCKIGTKILVGVYSELHYKDTARNFIALPLDKNIRVLKEDYRNLTFCIPEQLF